MSEQPPVCPPPGPGPMPQQPQSGLPVAHRESTEAMIWGLVAMVGGMFCFLPLVVGPVAWVKGARVVREIDTSPVPLGGRSEAQTGMIMGIVASALLGIGLLVAFFFIVLIAASTP